MAGQLAELLARARKGRLSVTVLGAETFTERLNGRLVAGEAAHEQAWRLLLEMLQRHGTQEQFEERAVDYAVTFELSPPSWEPAVCQIRQMRDAVTPHSKHLSHVSDVITSFVESQLHDDIEFVQVAALNLSGQLVGDISHTLRHLDGQLGASITLDIDCEHLLRVDFIAAGDLLNWVLARRSEDRQVTFIKPHRLVALFFGAMGINEHAKVKLQLV